MKEMTIKAVLQNVSAVTDFVNEELDHYDCPIKGRVQINVAIDEIFSNISRYAYGAGQGDATVSIEVEAQPLRVILTFSDHGVPFNPLEKAAPNVKLSAEEREIGGLGIFLVRKTMDAISYEYKDGMNILTIKKQL